MPDASNVLHRPPRQEQAGRKGARVPTEALCELLRANAGIAVLQLVKDALQREREAILGILSLRGVHVVDHRG